MPSLAVCRPFASNSLVSAVAGLAGVAAMDHPRRRTDPRGAKTAGLPWAACSGHLLARVIFMLATMKFCLRVLSAARACQPNTQRLPGKSLLRQSRQCQLCAGVGHAWRT